MQANTSYTDSAAGAADREGRIVVAEDQSPHTVSIRPGAAPRPALERAIAADARSRVRHSELTGKEHEVRCRQAGAHAAGRRAFRCTALVGGLRYPFLGVADLRAHRLTWCKRDPAPDPSQELPVSGRCRT